MRESWSTSPVSLLTFSMVVALLSRTVLGTEKCAEKEFVQVSGQLKLGSFVSIASYDVNTGDGRFQILRDDRRVLFEIEGPDLHFFIRSRSRCGSGVALDSLTGQHRSELAVLSWTGGAHCCFAASIYSLGKEPFLIQRIDLAHSGTPRFSDLDGDHVAEIVIEDWTFAYWKTSFSQSPAPTIVLKFNGERWVPASNLMVKVAPSGSRIAAWKKRVVEQFQETKHDASIGDSGDTGAPVTLWHHMLNLIYTGHADLALRFVNDAWPNENRYKDRFLSEFQEQLAQSPYYAEIKSMNPPVPLFF